MGKYAETSKGPDIQKLADNFGTKESLEGVKELLTHFEELAKKENSEELKKEILDTKVQMIDEYDDILSDTEKELLDLLSELGDMEGIIDLLKSLIGAIEKKDDTRGVLEGDFKGMTIGTKNALKSSEISEAYFKDGTPKIYSFSNEGVSEGDFEGMTIGTENAIFRSISYMDKYEFSFDKISKRRKDIISEKIYSNPIDVNFFLRETQYISTLSKEQVGMLLMNLPKNEKLDISFLSRDVLVEYAFHDKVNINEEKFDFGNFPDELYRKKLGKILEIYPKHAYFIITRAIALGASTETIQSEYEKYKEDLQLKGTFLRIYGLYIEKNQENLITKEEFGELYNKLQQKGFKTLDLSDQSGEHIVDYRKIVEYLCFHFEDNKEYYSPMITHLIEEVGLESIGGSYFYSLPNKTLEIAIAIGKLNPIWMQYISQNMIRDDKFLSALFESHSVNIDSYKEIFDRIFTFNNSLLFLKAYQKCREKFPNEEPTTVINSITGKNSFKINSLLSNWIPKEKQEEYATEIEEIEGVVANDLADLQKLEELNSKIAQGDQLEEGRVDNKEKEPEIIRRKKFLGNLEGQLKINKKDKDQILEIFKEKIGHKGGFLGPKDREQIVKILKTYENKSDIYDGILHSYDSFLEKEQNEVSKSINKDCVKNESLLKYQNGEKIFDEQAIQELWSQEKENARKKSYEEGKQFDEEKFREEFFERHFDENTSSENKAKIMSLLNITSHRDYNKRELADIPTTIAYYESGYKGDIWEYKQDIKTGKISDPITGEHHKPQGGTGRATHRHNSVDTYSSYYSNYELVPGEKPYLKYGNTSIPLTAHEAGLIDKNPALKENIVNFYTMFQELNLLSVWEYRKELVTAMQDATYINLEDNFLSSKEMLKFGNRLLKMLNTITKNDGNEGNTFNTRCVSIAELQSELRKFSGANSEISDDIGYNWFGEDRLAAYLRKEGIIGGAYFNTSKLIQLLH